MYLWTETCMQLQSPVSASTHARKDPNRLTKLHRYFTDWVVNNVFSNRFTNQRMHTQKPWDCVVYAVASNPPMIRAQAHSKTIIFKKQGASTKGSNSFPLLLPRLPPENMERPSILAFRSGKQVAAHHNTLQDRTLNCDEGSLHPIRLQKTPIPLNRCYPIA